MAVVDGSTQPRARSWTPWRCPIVLPEEYLRLPLSATALRLVATLCKFVDRRLTCYPSNRALLALMPPGTTERSLQRAKTELVDAGVLRHRGRSDGAGRQTSSAYLLLVPREDDVDVALPPTDSSGDPDADVGEEGDRFVGDEGDRFVTPGTSQKELLRKEQGANAPSVSPQGVIGKYHRLWEEKYGAKVAERGKVAGLLSRLVKERGVEDALGLVESYFLTEDRFAKESRHSIGAFVTILPRLVAEVAAATGQKGDDMEDYAQGLGKWG